MEEVEQKTVSIGDRVTYVDTRGKSHEALVVNVWGPAVYDMEPPAINLVYVSKSMNESDSFGRQIKRESSVVHRIRQSAEANYWEK